MIMRNSANGKKAKPSGATNLASCAHRPDLMPSVEQIPGPRQEGPGISLPGRATFVLRPPGS